MTNHPGTFLGSIDFIRASMIQICWRSIGASDCQVVLLDRGWDYMYEVSVDFPADLPDIYRASSHYLRSIDSP